MSSATSGMGTFLCEIYRDSPTCRAFCPVPRAASTAEAFNPIRGSRNRRTLKSCICGRGFGGSSAGCFLFDGLEDRAELAAGAFEVSGEPFARSEQRGDDRADGLLAR